MVSCFCLVALLASMQVEAWQTGSFVTPRSEYDQMTPDKLRSRILEVVATVHTGQHASVSFLHEGQQHHYDLVPHDIFSHDAMVFDENKRIEIPVAPTFRSREQGRWASMTAHADGKITGLFEHMGRIMEIQPVAHQEKKLANALLADYTKTYPAHLITIRDIAEAVPQQMRKLATTPVENPPGTSNNEIPQNPGTPSVVHSGTWGGTEWFPGCYTGDTQMHEFTVGITTDAAAKSQYSDLSTRLYSIVADASLVYEHQFNIRLKIGYWKQDEDYGACPADDDKIMEERLATTKALVDAGTIPFAGAVHAFSGCGLSYGLMGLAYVNTICQAGWNTGANKLAGTSPWLTFTHELGHNFNGAHSFENGQATTGGIMDYGDGTLDGHFQFNTQFRKTDMCATMNTYVNSCQDKFIVAPVTTSAAPTLAPTVAPVTTAAPTSAPTVAPTVAPVTTAAPTSAPTVAPTVAPVTTAAPTLAPTLAPVAPTPAPTPLPTVAPAPAPVPAGVLQWFLKLVWISNNNWWFSDHYRDFARWLAEVIAEIYGIDVNRVTIRNPWVQGGRRLETSGESLGLEVDIQNSGGRRLGDVTVAALHQKLDQMLAAINKKMSDNGAGASIGGITDSTPTSASPCGTLAPASPCATSAPAPPPAVTYPTTPTVTGTTTPAVTFTTTPVVTYTTTPAYVAKNAMQQEQMHVARAPQFASTHLLVLSLSLLMIVAVVVVIRMKRRPLQDSYTTVANNNDLEGSIE